MAKKSGLRLVQAEREKKNRIALQVFMSLQMLPLGERIKLAIFLLVRSDVRYFAKKNGVSVREFVRRGKDAK